VIYWIERIWCKTFHDWRGDSSVGWWCNKCRWPWPMF
jgi:hypothetical protein